MTYILWMLGILGGAFLYFQIGCLLGRLRWWTWHVNDRKNRILALLFFPWKTFVHGYTKRTPEKIREWRKERRDQRPFVDLYLPEEKNEYVVELGFCWPFPMIWNLVLIMGLPFYWGLKWIAAWSRWSYVYSASEFLLSLVIEGPTAVWKKWQEAKSTPLAPEEQVRIATEATDATDRPTLVSATEKDRERAAEHRALTEECAEIEAKQLAPRKKRIAQIEAEDAAEHNAFRDPPQEVRLEMKT